MLQTAKKLPLQGDVAPPPPRLRRSVSQQMAERFARRRAWRRLVAALYIAVMGAYLAWRFTIINPDSMALSVAYYVAECIGFVLGLTAIVTSWDYSHRTPPPAPAGLSVDVLVPCYREPLHIIRRTLIAARDISYPHKTFVLDDGRREEVRVLAAELGIAYLRRPENIHAKAGNLNFGLAHSTADFVMVFDADHIALPHALDLMLGFFSDPAMAMVQTPQDYYNTSAFQYFNAKSGGLWHDQSAFYNIAQPCADKVNASSCVGTGVVYRRAALDKIGGIPVETVTEDIHTSLKFHKAGLKTVFLNEPLAYGVAAADLGEYYKTRLRWGHGNLHALKAEKIFTCSGLTLMQRLHYIALGVIYLEAWQQLLLFAIPVVALTTGLQPFTITMFNIAIVLLFPFVSYALLQEMGCGFARYWANEIFSMARWPVYLKAWAGAVGRRIPFHSSAKNIEGRINWQLMAPQAGMAIASLMALAIGLIHLQATHFKTGPLVQVLTVVLTEHRAPDIDWHLVMPRGYTVDLFLIAGFWAIYGALRALLFIRKAIADAKNSHSFFRFRMPVPAKLNEGYICVSEISEDWLRFSPATELKAGEEVTLTLFLPAGPLMARVRIADVTDAGAEGRFIWESAREQDRLAECLYSVDWHREFRHRNAYFLTPSDLVLSAFSRKVPQQPQRAWQAVLYGEKKTGVLSNTDSAGDASLIVFETLAPGANIEALSFSPETVRRMHIHVVSEELLASLVEKGLDGTAVARYRVRTVA